MKRKIAILLIISFIAAVTVTACSNPSSNAPGENNKQNDAEINNAAENADEPKQEEIIYPELPEAQYGGYEMRFLVRDETHMIFVSKDIYAEEETGESVNDAVYKRNRTIEAKYEIKISRESVSNPGNFIQRLISAGDCPYDVMIEATGLSSALSGRNMIVDLKTVPHLDFDKPWWDQTLTKELTIGNKLFCNVSDLIIADKDGTWGVLFNKNIIQDYALEDPYKFVESGNWTIDKFYEMSRGVSIDLNGDGKYDVMDDMFGFATEPYNIFMMIIGSGCRLAEKDASDLPVMSAGIQRFLTAYEKAVEIDKDISTINASRITGAAASDPFYGGIIPAFDEGRIMFYMGSMALVPLFRGMEQDFGILPIPKFDESQEEYYTTMSVFNNGAIYIPITNQELERTGILIEALSAESRYTLLPAYYDLTLKTKMARDDESSAMLDILFGNRIIDVGAAYNFGGILDLVMGGKDDFVSGYERIEARANTAIQKVIDELTN